ncbi:bifunctional diguanylate cyclase/phosphodiesterase [Acetobacter fallax]|uniref:EAL domain-containing protein n=1 Tax=Acetobacter fallax TaxID=1737473 RepID=A0ABX0K812_9PROT|nr:EAL domain-containing protein [Acetobacter fallax]NHO31943.1 EAL domain-containing protein [Acetobacter fallax]NHO35541.1 EAL domain-containing protein [Acetobacter fallax]
MYDALPDLYDYNPGMIAGAAALCATSMLIVVRMVCRAAMVRGASRIKRLLLAAAVAGNGIWATHFLAMLGRNSAMDAVYAPGLTVLSAGVAFLIFFGAWWNERETPGRSFSPSTAFLMMMAVGGMHYIGISAMDDGALPDISAARVVTSLIFGFVLFYAGCLFLRRQHGPWRALATAPWVIGVCCLHFIGVPPGSHMHDMAAEEMQAGSVSLAGMVAAGTATFLILALIWLGFEYRVGLNRRDDNMRARNFADAAIEGLVVTDGAQIIDANDAFRKLVSWSRYETGSLGVCLPELVSGDILRALIAEEKPREVWLITGDDQPVPVEIYARKATWKGRTRTVLAVVDLRARKEAEAALRAISFQDSLTGIGNRPYFVSKLTDFLRQKGRSPRIAAFLIDVDRFKNINETSGHAAGDAVLAHIAQGISGAVPEGAVTARIAGDEFAVAFPADGCDPSAFAAQLAQQLKMPLDDRNNSVPVSVSVGFAVSDRDTPDGEALLHRLGVALLAAKQAGRGSVREYDYNFDTSIQDRFRMEQEIRLALDRNEFFLEYQPIMCTRTHRLTGYEALVRWQHPERGRIPPDQFIGVAEECGLIAELGEWVVRRACADAACWSNGLSVSVNVSPLQFATSDLPAVITAAVRDAGLDPARLDIEITENTLLQQGRQNMEILRSLRNLGAGVVMDDFGTGYSSLSYLRDFQFDKVKIDRSFIRDMLQQPHSAAIVDAILSLGKGLGIDIVAEGIETSEQLAYLEKRCCTLVQGYFIGRPGREIAEAPSESVLESLREAV